MISRTARTTTLESPDARGIREKLGLSQTQFAALIGISPRTLYRKLRELDDAG